MTDRTRLEELRRRKRLQELRAKAAGQPVPTPIPFRQTPEERQALEARLEEARDISPIEAIGQDLARGFINRINQAQAAGAELIAPAVGRDPQAERQRLESQITERQIAADPLRRIGRGGPGSIAEFVGGLGPAHGP